MTSHSQTFFASPIVNLDNQLPKGKLIYVTKIFITWEDEKFIMFENDFYNIDNFIVYLNLLSCQN